ncbi:hypothetical protein ACRAVF_25590 [Bradyrhizobium oligotrophicum S58]
MQNFKTEPTDMDQFAGDKTGPWPAASEVVALFKLIPAAAASTGTGLTGAFAGQP